MDREEFILTVRKISTPEDIEECKKPLEFWPEQLFEYLIGFLAGGTSLCDAMLMVESITRLCPEFEEFISRFDGWWFARKFKIDLDSPESHISEIRITSTPLNNKRFFKYDISKEVKMVPVAVSKIKMPRMPRKVKKIIEKAIRKL